MSELLSIVGLWNLSRFLPIGLLLLRLMVGIVFIDSGWNDLRNPQERSQSIGKSKNFTIFLGTAEVLGGAGVVLGIWSQLAALGLILVSLGAIYQRLFVWHLGFWGEKTYGWHYDLMLLKDALAQKRKVPLYPQDWLPMPCGARITRASSCWGIKDIAIP